MFRTCAGELKATRIKSFNLQQRWLSIKRGNEMNVTVDHF